MTKETLMQMGLTEEQTEAVLTKVKEVFVPKSELERLNSEYKDLEKNHEKELHQLKIDNAVERALIAAKSKSLKAVKAMLNLDDIDFNDDGTLSGLDEQLETLQKSDSWMFDTPQPTKFTGFQPGTSIPVSDSMTTGYETRLADARKIGDFALAVAIKREAAADGVNLF